MWPQVNEAATKVLKVQMAATLKLPEYDHVHVDAVAKAFLVKNRLYRKDHEKILPDISGEPKQISWVCGVHDY